MTRYSGNFIYECSILKLVLHSDGVVDMSVTPTYHYYLKDHLGNTRVVVDQNNTREQQSAYYPFGMSFDKAGSTDNPYLYNGKEQQTDLLAGSILDWYDYGARMYDPTLGRFHTQDRFAEKFNDVSPYQYALNNPIRYIDVNGDSSVVVISGTQTQTMQTTNGQQEYLGYQLNVYENMTLEQYNQLKADGNLPDANFSTYVGRDAHYMQKKDANGNTVTINHSADRYGTNNEAPPGEYYLFLSGTNGDGGGGSFQLYIGDANGSRTINGPDGQRAGIALHGWDPRFSQGCLTTFQSGSNGGVQPIINAIPDLNNDTQPVRMIIEPRPVMFIEKSGQTVRQGNPNRVPYRIDEF